MSVETAPANPFTQDVKQRLPDPTTLVIFGAGGDLASRKLLPAVYNLLLTPFVYPIVRSIAERVRSEKLYRW